MIKNISIMFVNAQVKEKRNPENLARDFLKSLGGAVYPCDLITIEELTKIKVKTYKGMPDLIYWGRDRKVKLIEVKGYNDTINPNQIKWALDNPELEIIFLFILQHTPDKKLNQGKYPNGLDILEYFYYEK